MDPQQQPQPQQQPVRMIYAHAHPQQPQQQQTTQLPPLPNQSTRTLTPNSNNNNNLIVMNNQQQQMIHGQQTSPNLQPHPIQQTVPIQRVSPPTMMMNTNNNNSTNSPQQVVILPPNNHQPLVIDQVPILYQNPNHLQQQVLVPTQQNYLHSFNQQQQQNQQQTNMYNNQHHLQSSSSANNLIFNNSNSSSNNSTIPSASPRYNTSPNSQTIPFSATTTALNQSINSNLMSSSQQESNYDQRRAPSISTMNHNNSNKKNSPPSPSPITKLANKVIDILTPNERATYVNLPAENQPLSTSNVTSTANQKSKAALKGLSNPMGEYNCFLNVVIQSLWNLEIFRELFLSIDPKNHKHKSFESCVYCSLQNLFTHFKYSENSILDPNLVRNSLSFAHNKDSKFQLKHMDDASEVFVSFSSSFYQY